MEKLWKKHILSLARVVEHSAVYSHWNMHSPLITIACRCATTISLIAVRRNYLPSIHPLSRTPDWSSWPASLKADFRTTVFSACLPPPHLPLPVFGSCIGESQTQHRSFPSYYILKLSLQQYPPHTSQQGLFSAAKEWLWFTLDSRKTNLELPSF